MRTNNNEAEAMLTSPVARDVLSLSNGTLRTLTNEPRYEVLDKLQFALARRTQLMVDAGELEPTAPWTDAWFEMKSMGTIERKLKRIRADADRNA